MERIGSFKILEKSWLDEVFLKLVMHFVRFVWRPRNLWITYLFIAIINGAFGRNLLIDGDYLGATQNTW